MAKSRVSSASPDGRPVLNSTVPFCVDSVKPQRTHSLQVNAKTNATPGAFTRPRPQNSFVACRFSALHADLAPELAQYDATELASTPDTSAALKETSRLVVNISGSYVVGVTILPRGGARDDLRTLSQLDKPPATKDLFASLGFHSLFTNLPPRAVYKSIWNESKLLHEQNDYETVAINADSLQGDHRFHPSATMKPGIWHHLRRRTVQILELQNVI